MGYGGEGRGDRFYIIRIRVQVLVLQEENGVEVPTGRGVVEVPTGRGVVEVPTGRGVVEVPTGRGVVEVPTGRGVGGIKLDLSVTPGASSDSRPIYASVSSGS